MFHKAFKKILYMVLSKSSFLQYLYPRLRRIPIEPRAFLAWCVRSLHWSRKRLPVAISIRLKRMKYKPLDHSSADNNILQLLNEQSDKFSHGKRLK
jgi:hypothetical protein